MISGILIEHVQWGGDRQLLKTNWLFNGWNKKCADIVENQALRKLSFRYFKLAQWFLRFTNNNRDTNSTVRSLNDNRDTNTTERSEQNEWSQTPPPNIIFGESETSDRQINNAKLKRGKENLWSPLGTVNPWLQWLFVLELQRSIEYL